jgi:peptidoglycan hydrolase-like protein with peptidoglycan-binding domain
MRKRYTQAFFGIACICLFGVLGANIASAQPFSLFTSSDLTVGSRGQAVIDLQGILSEMGYLSVPRNVPLGYFGPLTKSALMKYQTALGVKATGYFGSETRTAIFSQFSSNRWVDSSGTLGIGMSSASNSGGSNSSSMTTSSGSNNATQSGSSMTALTPTGYWYNGSWYNSLPNLATTTPIVSGYWYNGTWYSANSGTYVTSSSGSNTTSNGGTGYWYNGVWNAVNTNQTGGGYYSSNPGYATGGSY